MPNADREFYERDTEVIVAAGTHVVEVRGWALKIGSFPQVVRKDGDPVDPAIFTTVGPTTVELTAEGGRGYELRFARIPFDRTLRHISPPGRPTYSQDWTVHAEALPDCPMCPR
jgi:hypothetical protein